MTSITRRQRTNAFCIQSPRLQTVACISLLEDLDVRTVDASPKRQSEAILELRLDRIPR